MCGDRTDSRHIREIDAENPIEFTPKIKNDRFMVLTSMLGLLCLWRNLGIRRGVRRQIYHVGSDLAINFYDQLLIIAVRGQRLPECKQVYTTIIALECLCDRVVTTSDAAIT